MPQKIKTYEVDYKSNDPTKPKFKDSGKSEMKTQDWIEIKLDDKWPDSTTIDSITFYNNAVVDGEDQKDESSVLGEWTSAGGNGSSLTGYYSCSESNGVVTVTDEQTLSSGQESKHWFEVDGTIGGTSPAEAWSVDPELINKSRG